MLSVCLEEKVFRALMFTLSLPLLYLSLCMVAIAMVFIVVLGRGRHFLSAGLQAAVKILYVLTVCSFRLCATCIVCSGL